MCGEPAQPLRLGLREPRPCGDVRITVSGVPRSASIASSARKIGSGFSTIPGPPPYGTSSTTRCRSVVKSRRSRTFTSSVPALDRAAEDARRQRLLDHRRKDRDDVERASYSGPSRPLVQLQQPVRRIDHDPLRRRVDRRADRRDQRNQHLRRAAPSTTSRLPVSVPSTSLTDADRLARPPSRRGSRSGRAGRTSPPAAAPAGRPAPAARGPPAPRRRSSSRRRRSR